MNMKHYFVAMNGVEAPKQSESYPDAVKRNQAADATFKEMKETWDVVIVLCLDVTDTGEIFTAALQNCER
jgi:hypothetical protein